MIKAQQFIPLVTKISCNSISKKQTEVLNVRANYQWQGPAVSISGYAIVTSATILDEFDGIGSTQMNFTATMPNSPDSPIAGYFIVTGLPLAGCAAKSGYGVKVKVTGFAEWGCKDVLTVTEVVVSLSITQLQLS